MSEYPVNFRSVFLPRFIKLNGTDLCLIQSDGGTFCITSCEDSRTPLIIIPQYVFDFLSAFYDFILKDVADSTKCENQNTITTSNSEFRLEIT